MRWLKLESESVAVMRCGTCFLLFDTPHWNRPMSSNPPSTGKRVNWFDEKSQTPLIDHYARNLTSFIDTLADGKVDAGEIKSQEARVLDLMKEVEPKLDDALHAQITALLCELTAYDLMQTLHQMQRARPRTAFRG